jgi:hypothetical protein
LTGNKQECEGLTADKPNTVRPTGLRNQILDFQDAGRELQVAAELLSFCRAAALAGAKDLLLVPAEKPILHFVQDDASNEQTGLQELSLILLVTDFNIQKLIYSPLTRRLCRSR